MRAYLPIGIEELLHGAVETARIEFTASWDAETTGVQILKTLCAFANDLHHLNGGYIIIGVAEQRGVAMRPVKGLEQESLDAAQKWIRGHCNRIEPTYAPVMDVVEVDARRVLVLWAPASDQRPHQAPDGPRGVRKYWVRLGSETVEARDATLTLLMQQTAKVPFDDRRAHDVSNDALSFSLVKEFLRDVQSELRHEPDAERVYRSMQIVARVNGHTVPRHVALLFFTPEPEQWFRGARIEVVEFQDDQGGSTLSEKVFRGPLPHQLRQCLLYLESMTTRHIEKSATQVDARGWLSFPVPALREALVNAVYHRSYEGSVEPTKIYLYPDRIEVISYPGPLPGIERHHLDGTTPVPPVPARNRRIGEYLKELRLAEARGTGLPRIRRSMAENGSPAPTFDFDDARSYFRVTLAAHPEHLAHRLLSDYAYKKATGAHADALSALQLAWREGLRSPSLATTLVREALAAGDVQATSTFLEALEPAALAMHAPAIMALAQALATRGDELQSRDWLDRLPTWLAARDAMEAALLERRLGRMERAHGLFEQAAGLVNQDVRASHEFAQVKLSLARALRDPQRLADQGARQRLLHEAQALLERVIQLEAPPSRHAWAWFHLGQTRQELSYPRHEVEAAYARACELLPDEPLLQDALRAHQGAT